MQAQTYTAPAGRPELTERDAILECLAAFINQRSGIEFRNYGDVRAFRSEQRSITKDGKQARELLAAVRWRSSIDADALKAALRGAFSGRLTWDAERRRLDYCAGQYFPTEYRRAVCAVLASALWGYFRENMPADGEGSRKKGESAGDYLRRTARREFGRAIAGRWFN